MLNYSQILLRRTDSMIWFNATCARINEVFEAMNQPIEQTMTNAFSSLCVRNVFWGVVTFTSMICTKKPWCEKGSRADNGGFVSAKMTARKRSFFTILFAQCTHDTNGIHARKCKAKRCVWAHNLSFGLLYYASWF